MGDVSQTTVPWAMEGELFYHLHVLICINVLLPSIEAGRGKEMTGSKPLPPSPPVVNRNEMAQAFKRVWGAENMYSQLFSIYCLCSCWPCCSSSMRGFMESSPRGFSLSSGLCVSCVPWVLCGPKSFIIQLR